MPKRVTESTDESANKKSKPSKIWRWGFMGAGKIAHDFAAALRTLDNCDIVAVGARSLDGAKDFAKRFSIKNATSYEGVAKDAEVDIVYVNTIHPTHFELVKLALENGKSVLCEKPLTLNANETSQLIDLARSKKLFFMEAMWTRYFPAVESLRKLLHDGTLGEPRAMIGDFSFCNPTVPRLVEPELGGGALLDVGVYQLAFASMVFGGVQPSSIQASAHVVDGVDRSTAIVMTYGKHNEKQALIHCSVETEGTKSVTIMCEKGRVIVPKPFWCPTTYTVVKGTAESIHKFDVPKANPNFDSKFESSAGMVYEAQRCMEYLDQGLLESPLEPLAESLLIMKLMDTIRHQVGIVYPNETSATKQSKKSSKPKAAATTSSASSAEPKPKKSKASTTTTTPAVVSNRPKRSSATKNYQEAENSD